MDLPTREEAQHADEFDSALWVDEWEMAADLVMARADGILQTGQEWRNSLEEPESETLWRALPHEPETTTDWYHDPYADIYFVAVQAREVGGTVELAALGGPE